MKRRVSNSIARFRRDQQKFEAWLRDRGSEIREPSNEYELARFTTPEGVGVIYCNASGAISSWVGGSLEAYKAFMASAPWRVGKSTKRRSGSKAEHQIAAVIKRDGNECWYCGLPFGDDQFARTKEHLVSVTHGGPDHIANIVVAHKGCNLEAGNLSVSEKCKLREAKRFGVPREKAA